MTVVALSVNKMSCRLTLHFDCGSKHSMSYYEWFTSGMKEIYKEQHKVNIVVKNNFLHIERIVDFPKNFIEWFKVKI